MIERSASALRVVPALAIVVALWWGREVFIPIVLSILVSYALEPIVAALESRHVHRAIAAPIVVLAVLAALGFGMYGLRG
jgi:predicted PurR-regulated permease PerM